jgi:tetratricopeptide (TPR) repeat protein
MTDPYLRDRIEQFLLGQLPPEEAARLEVDIASDPALAKQVALQRLALMGMQRLAARDMREHFERWDAEMPDKPGENGKLWRWATIVLAVLLGTAVYQYQQTKNAFQKAQELEQRQIAARDTLIAALRADYQRTAVTLDSLLTADRKQGIPADDTKRLRLELDKKEERLRALERQDSRGRPQVAMLAAPPPPRFRGSGEAVNPVIRRARTAFDNSDYDEAVQQLTTLGADDPSQAQVRLLLPYALFYAGRFNEAIPAFIALWETDPDNETMNAQGYLLLCHIAVGNVREARQLQLTILQQPKHKFYATAKSLPEL